MFFKILFFFLLFIAQIHFQLFTKFPRFSHFKVTSLLVALDSYLQNPMLLDSTFSNDESITSSSFRLQVSTPLPDVLELAYLPTLLPFRA